MSLQSLSVALIVTACSGYAAWKLMPAVARRGLAGALAKWPWPAPIAARLSKVAQRSGGCGCDGCDGPPAGPATGVSVIRIQRRPKPPHG